MTISERVAKGMWTLGKSESRLFCCDFTDALEDLETLSTIVGVAESTGQIAVASSAINTGGPTIADDETILINKCVLVRLTAVSGEIGRTYDVVVTVTTSDANTLAAVCRLIVS